MNGRRPPGPPMRPQTPAPPSSGSGVRASTLPPEVTAAMADPKRRLGRHVLLSELGRGGMGVVYRGYDLSLGRPVAIKMVLHAEMAGEHQLRRFAQEARAAARLRHPSIVAVHEVGEHDGIPYLVMDLIEGRALDAQLEGGALPPRRAAEIARTLAGALHHAHGERIIHRDVKPQNVLLDGEGRPYVTDFGLARERDAGSGLTATGAFIGTPGYAPPEQVSGRHDDVGPCSDVYALGAVLYHMLTGRAPFVGDSVMNVIVASLRSDPPSPLATGARVHRDLDTITMRCLAKEPASRYADAGALEADLRRFLDGEPIVARPIGAIERAGRWIRRHRGVAALVAGLTVAVAVAVVASVLVLRSEGDEAARRERRLVVESARSDAAAGLAALQRARDAAFSEDVADDADERARRLDAAIDAGLAATQATGRLAKLAPADEAAAQTAFDASMLLGEVARAAEQWSVAASAFEEAGGLGIDDGRARAALASVTAARRAGDEVSRRAVEAILDRAATGGGLSVRSGGFEEALFGIAGHRSAGAVEAVAERLGELSTRLRRVTREALFEAAEPTPIEARQGVSTIEDLAGGLAASFPVELRDAPAPTAASPWDEPRVAEAARRLERRDARQRSFEARARSLGIAELVAADQEQHLGPDGVKLARLCCQALGRLGIADETAIGALAIYIESEADPVRAAAAGVALCELGGEDAERAILRGKRLHGEPYWRKLRPHLEGTRIEERAADLEDDEVGSAIERGRLLEDRGDREGALAAFADAARRHPDRADAWREAGRLRLATGDTDGALRDLDRAIAIAPDDVRATAYRAVALARLGRAEDAQALTERAVAAAPDDPDVWLARAEVLSALGRPAEGIDALGRALELAPRRADLWAIRGRLKATLGEAGADGADADLTRAVELAPRDARYRTDRAIVRRDRGDLTPAKADAEGAVEIDPGDARAWKLLGELRAEADDPGGAIAAFERAALLAPDADTFRALATARRLSGDHAGAVADYDRAFALSPRTFELLLLRAHARAKSGDLEGAIADGELFLERAPDHAEAPAVAAWVKGLRQ